MAVAGSGVGLGRIEAAYLSSEHLSDANLGQRRRRRREWVRELRVVGSKDREKEEKEGKELRGCEVSQTATSEQSHWKKKYLIDWHKREIHILHLKNGYAKNKETLPLFFCDKHFYSDLRFWYFNLISIN